MLEEVILHIGSLFTDDLENLLKWGEVVIVSNKSASKEKLQRLRADQIVIDLVNLDKARCPDGGPSYEGICW